jgi:hypothetical protein
MCDNTNSIAYAAENICLLSNIEISVGSENKNTIASKIFNIEFIHGRSKNRKKSFNHKNYIK